MKTNEKWLVFILFITVGIVLYYQYQKKIEENDPDDFLQNSLLVDDEKDIHKNKPKLWVYIPYEYNSRHWQSFGSRSSYQLNQPYLYLTIKSIIKFCSKDFHICIIDDYSFKRLIPNLSFQITDFSDPTKYYLKFLCMLKILDRYGGMFLPISFLCCKNLLPMYNNGIKNNKIFVGENICKDVRSQNVLFCPNIDLIGSTPNNPIIQKFIEEVQITISRDYTDEAQFLGKFNRWCLDRQKVNIIPAPLLGVQDTEGKTIVIDDLLSQKYIHFSNKMYGIWIPQKDILTRTSYSWFARMSKKQILQSDIILSKYILLSNTPFKKNVPIVSEPLQNPPWVSFWKVPSQAPLWGLKPNFLGDSILRSKYS